MAEKRRAAIEYFYINIYGCHDDINSIVTPIMKNLRIPRGNFYDIKALLQDLKSKTGNLDANTGKKDGRGKKPLIQDFSDEAKIIYDMAERGIGNERIVRLHLKESVRT